MNTAAAIYPGKTSHARFGPKDHRFEYRTLYQYFDIDKLSQASEQNLFFSHNQFNLFSLKDQDFLEWGDLSLRSKVEAILEKNSIAIKPDRIELLTCPRFFNYVFNPVSFFFCKSRAGELEAVIV